MEAIKHYKAYKPRPLNPEEDRKITVLYGGLTWKHERLVQGAFHNLDYQAEPLPNISRADLDAGKEMIDSGACCPTVFTTGNLVNLLKTKSVELGKETVANQYAFLTVGACGPCRFGQYHESYAMALKGLGLEDFRLFLLSQNRVDQGAENQGGFNISFPLTTGIIWAILCGDILTDMEYMTRPYEVFPGKTEEVLKESVEYLYQVFKHRPVKGKKWGVLAWHLLSDYFTSALREVKKKWETIQVDRLQVKPKVKVTGEFWLQTHEGEGNYNIKRWLEQEGAEVIPPPIAVWLDYLVESRRVGFEDRRGLDRNLAPKIAAARFGQRLFHRTYNPMRRAMGYIPNELPDQKELRELATPYYHYKLRGGEGHMLVGKALYAHHHRKAHMICELSPYSCMPNTMSIGAMAKVTGDFPDLLYAPIEMKGDAEAHALSRCQMILTEAKKRAHQEFEEAMRKGGITVERIRDYEAKSPEVVQSTYRIPHHGYAGTAVNYALHLHNRSRGGILRRIFGSRSAVSGVAPQVDLTPAGR
jgi:predicted nucleotide-binding protein (sugar kinase/HSP70/actin superfamily)